jgi:hypothetical protein
MDEIRKIVPALPKEGGTEKKLAEQSLCSAHFHSTQRWKQDISA